MEHVRVNPSVAATRSPARALAGVFLAPIFWTISVLVAAVAMGSVSMAGTARAATGPEDFADMADALVPAVVNISTAQVAEPGASPFPRFPPGSPFEEFFKDFFERRGEKGEKEDKGEESEQQPRPRATSLGSGFVIDSEGYIVTNNHVIADADEITVIFSDDTTLKAELIGRDPKTDLALLKVTPEQPLVAVEWGDSDAARVGHWVLAIGNPFGLGSTVTAGIISARARDINARRPAPPGKHDRPRRQRQQRHNDQAPFGDCGDGGGHEDQERRAVQPPAPRGHELVDELSR